MSNEAKKSKGMKQLETKRIIYYTIENDSKITLPLRNLCTKDSNENRLELIFYAAKDAKDAETLLEILEDLYYESFELIEENASHILFKVIDVYENINYLKFQKAKKLISKEKKDENN